MKTYTGRQTVEAGLYLNTKTFTVQMLDKTGTLDGTELETYRRIPMLLMLAAAPVLGLAYVMFLPFIGFATVLHLVGTKTLQLAGEAATEGVRVRRCHLALAQQPRLAGAKTLNRLENVLARSEWDDPVIAEGLIAAAGYGFFPDRVDSGDHMRLAFSWVGQDELAEAAKRLASSMSRPSRWLSLTNVNGIAPELTPTTSSPDPSG